MDFAEAVEKARSRGGTQSPREVLCQESSWDGWDGVSKCTPSFTGVVITKHCIDLNRCQSSTFGPSIEELAIRIKDN